MDIDNTLTQLKTKYDKISEIRTIEYEKTITITNIKNYESSLISKQYDLYVEENKNNKLVELLNSLINSNIEKCFIEENKNLNNETLNNQLLKSITEYHNLKNDLNELKKYNSETYDKIKAVKNNNGEIEKQIKNILDTDDKNLYQNNKHLIIHKIKIENVNI